MSNCILVFTVFITIFLDSSLCHQQESNFDLRFKEIDYIRESLRGNHIKVHSMNVGQYGLSLIMFLNVSFLIILIRNKIASTNMDNCEK